ncbi:MAG: carboxypeptidase regulatory-like domain-containing protein [Deltaproteobacteria bacterium]|nr:carboxypeptidase regulatory-like domain-containing protein [Deltaproteobacteria bacterium]
MQWILATALLILFFPTESYATCWSSTGGNGNAWLEVTVSAGGSPVQDVNVSLQPVSWSSGSSSVYESACTDSNGVARFRTVQSQSSDCYSTYYYGTYANYRAAHCYEYYIENESSYSAYSLDLTDYKVVAYPPYNSTIAERYGNGNSDEFDIDFDGSLSQSIVLPEKDIIVRVRVTDDAGSAVTSGLTMYVSGPNYTSKEIASSFTDVYVVSGTHYIGAWCTNYQSCSYGCISYRTITADEDDAIVEVNLTAKRNSATISGVVSGSDGALLENASVSLGNYDGSSSADSCYAWGYDQADSSGYYSISIPPGNYTTWTYPPYTGGSTSYASSSESVTLAADTATTKNFTLQSKDSSLSFTAVDNGGNAVANAWCNAWTYSDGNNDWGYCQTGSAGTCSISALSGLRYNTSCSYWDSTNWMNQTISNFSNEGMQTIEAPGSASFTFALWDHTVNFCLVDENGNGLSDIHGGGSIRPASSDDDDYWYGTWISFDGGSCTSRRLASSTTYEIEPYIWGNLSYDPLEATTDFTSGESGGSTAVNITMIPIDATVTGSYIDDEGNALDLDTTYISVHARKGSIWRQCEASASSYTCRLSAGRWCFGYWHSGSGYASLSPGSSSSCLDITAGGTQASDLTFLRTASINVTVQDNQGSAVRWVWIEASAFSAADRTSDADRRRYDSNGCSTNNDGQCTITVGAATAGTTYYLKAYRPWSEMNEQNLTLPEEISVSVTPGGSVDAATLLFRRFDGELAISVVSAEAASLNISKGIPLPHPVINAQESLAESIVGEVWISAYSELGGYSEVTTDGEGHATLKCVSGDVWNVFGVNLIGSNLYLSEAAEVTCVPVETEGATAVNITMNLAGTVPESLTQTWDAGVANTLTLTDNFSLQCPALALGDSGEEVTCTVQPDPFLPYQSGNRPTAQHGYDITCNDAEGAAITSLNGNCDLCLPINTTQLANLGIEAEDQDLCYRDTATDAYLCLTGCTIDTTRGTMCCQTNHFTEFTLVGNGNLSGVDGDTEDAAEEAERTGETMTGEVGASSAAGSCGCRIDAAGHFQVLDLMIWLLALVPAVFVRVASQPSRRFFLRTHRRHVR